MNTDPLVASIRDARHRISAECGHDPKRLVAYYRERERKLRVQNVRRFVERKTTLAETAALKDETKE